MSKSYRYKLRPNKEIISACPRSLSVVKIARDGFENILKLILILIFVETVKVVVALYVENFLISLLSRKVDKK